MQQSFKVKFYVNDVSAKDLISVIHYIFVVLKRGFLNSCCRKQAVGDINIIYVFT